MDDLWSTTDDLFPEGKDVIETFIPRTPSPEEYRVPSPSIFDDAPISTASPSPLQRREPSPELFCHLREPSPSPLRRTPELLHPSLKRTASPLLLEKKPKKARVAKPKPVRTTLKKLGIVRSSSAYYGRLSTFIHHNVKPHPVVADADNVLNGKRISLKQARVSSTLLQLDGLIAAWDTGTGKTFLAVLSALVLLIEKKVENVLVVTPLSLRNNFQDALEEMKVGEILYEHGIEGFRFNVVTNGELMREYGDMLLDDNHARSRATAIARAKLANTFLIIDEAHVYRTNILMTERSQKGINTVMMLLISSMCAKRLLLTATPIYNHIYDLVILCAIADGRLELYADPGTHARTSFFCDQLYPVFDRRITFATNTDPEILTPALQEGIDDYKTPCFPSITYKDISIKIDEGKLPSYVQAENDVGTAQFYHGPRVADNMVEGLKMEKVLKIINEASAEKSIMFASHYVDEKNGGTMQIRQHLDTLGISYVYIDGTTSEQGRAEAVSKFNEREARVIILSKSAGGQGLDLKGTRIVLLMESGWNDASEKQAVGRACRNGSHSHLPEDQRNVTVYRICVDIESKHRMSGDAILRRISENKKTKNNYLLDELRKCDPLRSFE